MPGAKLTQTLIRSKKKRKNKKETHRKVLNTPESDQMIYVRRVTSIESYVKAED